MPQSIHRSAFVALAATFALAACNTGDDWPPIDGERDAARDAGADAPDAPGPDLDARPDDLGPVVPDAGPDADADAGPAPLYLPTVMEAQVVYQEAEPLESQFMRQLTLPKLAADATHLYALHAISGGAIEGRRAFLMRRAIAGGDWSEVAVVRHYTGRPGIVTDEQGALHLSFVCDKLSAMLAPCLVTPGAVVLAITDNLFSHVVFSDRGEDGALLFDSFDYVAQQAGVRFVAGLGVIKNGTWWSLRMEDDALAIQSHDVDSAAVEMVAQFPVGTEEERLERPIHASLGAESMILAQRLNPTGEERREEAVVFQWNPQKLKSSFARSSSNQDPSVTTALAAPADVVYGPDGVAYALARIYEGDAQCTELWRFDRGDGDPSILPVGCQASFARMQFSGDGTLYLIAQTNNPPNSFKIGASADRGETWSWGTIAISGPLEEGVNFVGLSPLKSYTGPLGYDPNKLRFLFTGQAEGRLYRTTYFGEVDLEVPRAPGE